MTSKLIKDLYPEDIYTDIDCPAVTQEEIDAYNKNKGPLASTWEQHGEYATNAGLTFCGGYIKSGTKDSKRFNATAMYYCSKHRTLFRRLCSSVKTATPNIGCDECRFESMALKESTIIKCATELNLTYLGGYNMKERGESLCSLRCEIHNLLIEKKSKNFTSRNMDGKLIGGCPQCASEVNKHTEEEFIKSIAHTEYRYVRGYKNTNKSATFWCPYHNGEFDARPSGIKVGKGCGVCYAKGYKSDRIGKLYFYMINKDNSDYIGFGITNKLERRDQVHQYTFNNNGCSGTLVLSFTGEGTEIQSVENEIKKLFNEYRVNLNIDGFRKEALTIESLPYVIRYIKSLTFPMTPHNEDHLSFSRFMN